jgi:hypothetical protein
MENVQICEMKMSFNLVQRPRERLAMGWTAEDQCSNPGRVKNFLFSTSSRPALGPTQPPIKGYMGPFPRGKRPGA